MDHDAAPKRRKRPLSQDQKDNLWIGCVFLATFLVFAILCITSAVNPQSSPSSSKSDTDIATEAVTNYYKSQGKYVDPDTVRTSVQRAQLRAAVQRSQERSRSHD